MDIADFYALYNYSDEPLSIINNTFYNIKGAGMFNIENARVKTILRNNIFINNSGINSGHPSAALYIREIGNTWRLC